MGISDFPRGFPLCMGRDLLNILNLLVLSLTIQDCVFFEEESPGRL